MKVKPLVFNICIFLSVHSFSQTITATQLLDNAINYHDPNNSWSTIRAKFIVEMTTPNASKRISRIRMDLAREFFSIKTTKDTITKVYAINKGLCSMVFNGKDQDSSAAKQNNMSCNKAVLYKNYYTYLYGLPMKLKDEGTILNEKVEERTFNNKSYLVLKVTYDKAVGNDVWYFYFNPKTFAMEVYQFYKTDENGKVKPNSGEYILLSEELEIKGIKMPKIRAWYYNKDNGYLGTDTLIKD